MAESAAIQSEKYVRVATAARRLDCHPSTLKELVFRGELAAIRFGDRGHWRVSEDSLRQLLERSKNDA